MFAWGPFRRSRREESNQLDWLRALLKNDEGAEGVEIGGQDLYQLPRHQLRFGPRALHLVQSSRLQPEL
jgi:hypothetical protein